MKRYFKHMWSLVLIAAIGCSDFANTNVSPNGSTVPLTSALLTNALSAHGGAAGASGTGITCGLYCQYFAQTLYTDASRYSLQDVNWTELNGSMYDLQNIININSDPATKDYAALNGSNNNQLAVARILKAIRFSVLTDRYGDMPYSEAMKGISTPKYDTQQSIYTDIFKELKEAVAQFDNLPAAKGDILMGGDITKWKKYANSWRLILALRMSLVDPVAGKAQFNDAMTDAKAGTSSPIYLLLDHNDDVTLNYPGTAAEFYNPWYGFGGDQNVSTTIADWMNTTGDARRFQYGKVITGSNLIGVPPGLNRDDALAYTTDPANKDHSLILNDSYRQPNSKLFILTAGTVLLARAEAAELGWTTEDRDQLYADGIMESWSSWDVYGDGSAYSAYMSNALVDLASGSSSVAEKIATQRWLAFYPDGPQGWAEWRRTGYPVISPAPQPLNPSGEIPRRFIYPTIEYGLNPANVATAAGLIDSKDTQDGHVWWDKH